ncbi:MAG: prephenate dehydrogenase [Chloroflexi bacterium]|nr:prephenate dehydrogenase [Chloroflexota bacterium]
MSRIAIIGGAGKMGRWLAGFLTGEGKPVSIAGRRPEKLREVQARLPVEVASSAEAVRQADIVVVSVPPDSFEEVIREIAPHTRAGQTVVDITSVKSRPVAIMHRYIKEALVLGAHPLFGPGAAGLKGQNVVLTPTTEPETARANEFKGYLEARGAKVTLMTPEAHDEIMAIVLGLSHFIGVVTADTLLSSGKLAEAEALGGTTFKLLLTLARSVISEDPELYASLQTALPAAGIEQRFLTKAGELAGLVGRGDSAGFARRMAALQKGFDRDALAGAYRKMNRISEILSEAE